jgi:hypothetical protein
MNITYLDTDSREVVAIVDDPALCIWEAGAERFAVRLGATVVKILPTPYENEWQVELKIPTAVRRLHMPLPGDPVRFTAKADVHECEVTGTYQFKRDRFYVILDNDGEEWGVQSMWEMIKV